MNQEHIKFFACPACKSSLENHSEQGEAATPFLRCIPCKADYPIVNDIPRFTKNLSQVKNHTASSFGYKWRKFSEIDDHYKKNFYDELSPIDPAVFFRGKTVLDAGTGMGIPSHCIAEQGAKTVYGVDISDSIEIAADNNRIHQNVIIAQADIHALPFHPESFDVVVCVAVLQHVPDFKKAFNELLRFVKPGGTIIIWVYAREGNSFVHYGVEPLRKIFTRHMPVPLTLALSIPLGMLFQLIIKFVYKPCEKLGWRFLPLHEYMIYRTKFDLRMNIHMIFDQLLAPLSYLFTRQEVAAFFERDEIASVTIRHHNANSWTAIGTKKC